MTHQASLLRDLRDAVGPQHVLHDPETTAGYRSDWTRRYLARDCVVVRPGSTADVAAAVAACVRYGEPVVPQGGNTGLVGGGVPLDGGVLLSLNRLRGVAVDPSGDRVLAGAGATVATVQAAASDAGRFYSVDLASRDGATVGGTIATNAGGLRVLAYGTTRAQVLGMEVVLATGTILSRLEGLPRDNTGFDLTGLMSGSEGTLGVVTRALLRLIVPPCHVVVALVAFRTARAALEAAPILGAGRLPLRSVEFMVDEGVELVRSVTGLPRPFPARAAAYLLVEAAADVDPTDVLAEALSGMAGVVGTAVEAGPAGARLWAYRDRHTEAISTVGVPHKLDVTVPRPQLADFVEEARSVLAGARPDARLWTFGHAGEGSVHLNVTDVSPDDQAVDDLLLARVVARGGSVSAEHGIGRAKIRWMSEAWGIGGVAAMRAVKDALDPRGVLNPGVLVPGPAASP